MPQAVGLRALMVMAWMPEFLCLNLMPEVLCLNALCRHMCLAESNPNRLAQQDSSSAAMEKGMRMHHRPFLSLLIRFLLLPYLSLSLSLFPSLAIYPRLPQLAPRFPDPRPSFSHSPGLLSMTAAGVSHPSSPRLPSPPPFTEVQIGPKSPLIGDTLGKDAEELLGASPADERRIRPGTKALDMAAGPPLIPLSQVC